ncbi:hypothetical protein ACTA71_009634 [Dictyostelium dimigraforme]
MLNYTSLDRELSYASNHGEYTLNGLESLLGTVDLAEKFDFACLFKYLSIRGQAVSLLNEKGNAETFVNTMMKMKMPRYILILMFLNKELENNFFLELRNDFGIIFLKMTAIIKKKIIYRFTKSLSKCY